MLIDWLQYGRLQANNICPNLEVHKWYSIVLKEKCLKWGIAPYQENKSEV